MEQDFADEALFENKPRPVQELEEPEASTLAGFSPEMFEDLTFVIGITDERMNKIVNGSSASLHHSEQEIAGYRDALAQVHTEYGNMYFRQADILRLHAIRINTAGYSYTGKHKENDTDIIEEKTDRRRRVRFYPTSAADTPDEVEQLVLAYSFLEKAPAR